MQVLVGGLKQWDVIGTIKNIAEKLLEQFPSHFQVNECSNFLCDDFINETSSTVISLNAFDGKIDLEIEILHFYSSIPELCKLPKCGKNRENVIKPINHILIELVSVPIDLHASVSEKC